MPDREDFRIDEDELIQLALDLCNIPSPAGHEGEAGQFVYQWLRSNDIAARKIGMFPDRFNVLGTIPGAGDGYSLIFNSHLDTGKHPDDRWSLRNAEDPIYNSAWREGDTLVGEGIVNDKGLMSAWLIAAKAIRRSGVELKGDLLLSAVAGEIGTEPVDDFQAPQYMSKEVGARWLIQHGAVADYALVAEGTAFRTGWVEAGKAFFKITVHGDRQFYTPFVPDADVSPQHPNAIVRAALIVPAIQEWGRDYTKRFTHHGAGGTIVPKVVIGAIRGGNPQHVTRTSELCSLYLDVRLVPDQDPLALKRELKELLAQQGVPGDVELFLYRRSYEADDPGQLLESIRRCHRDQFGSDVEMADSPFVSMWRDVSIFNEMGIPAVTYGPGSSVRNRTTGLSMKIDDLVAAARLYASIALDLCRQEKPRQ